MKLLLVNHFPPLLARIASANSVSMCQSRALTDIEYYKSIEYSHLHIWESQSAKRKFLLKLEQLEKEKAAKSQNVHASIKPRHPSTLRAITLPEYIERKPSELLRILASAVKRDPTAPEYKYHDDPYLIPYNSMRKRDYIMAKDGGRKAARFILDQHPELFEKNLIEAQPPIKAFMPKTKVTEKNLSENLLQIQIEGFNVEDSIDIYEKLKKKNVDVSIHTKQSLLELICYHNGEPELEDDHNDKAGITSMKVEVVPPKWNEENKAENIYQDIIKDSRATESDKCSANLALLNGMVKFDRKNDAMVYYEMTKDVKTLSRYNAGILCLPVQSDDFFENWEGAKNILAEMAAEGVKPDGVTLINLLKFIREISTADSDYTNACKLSLSLLTEFKSMQVLPSLGAYRHLIEIFVTKTKRSMIVFDIVEELEERVKANGNESLLKTVIHVDDFSFFRKAIEKASRLLNVKLAHKIHDLYLQHTENEVLLGDYNSRNLYYRYFVTTILRREPISMAMEYLSDLAPHQWTPTHKFYIEVISEIKAQQAYEYLPQVWTDLQVSDFCSISREGRFDTIRQIIDVTSQADLQALGLTNLRDAWMRIAGDCFEEIVNSKKHRIYPLSSNVHIVPIANSLLCIALDLENFEMAGKVMSFCREEVTTLIGSLDEEILSKFLDTMLIHNDRDGAYNCVVYAAEQKYESAMKMAQRLLPNIALSDVEKNQLNLLFAHETEWIKL